MQSWPGGPASQPLWSSGSPPTSLRVPSRAASASAASLCSCSTSCRLCCCFWASCAPWTCSWITSWLFLRFSASSMFTCECVVLMGLPGPSWTPASARTSWEQGAFLWGSACTQGMGGGGALGARTPCGKERAGGSVKSAASGSSPALTHRDPGPTHLSMPPWPHVKRKVLEPSSQEGCGG